MADRDPTKRDRNVDRWYYNPKTFLSIAVVVLLAAAGQLIAYGKMIEKVDTLSTDLKEQTTANHLARTEMESRIYRDLNRIYDRVFASRTRRSFNSPSSHTDPDLWDE